jgi:hypothetical protein
MGLSKMWWACADYVAFCGGLMLLKNKGMVGLVGKNRHARTRNAGSTDCNIKTLSRVRDNAHIAHHAHHLYINHIHPPTTIAHHDIHMPTTHH